MRSRTLFISATTAAIALAMTSTAYAQEKPGSLALRLEPGIAVPLTQPQTDRFLPGFGGAMKLDITLVPWFSVGPDVSLMVLPSTVAGVSAGTGTFLGGFARMKRPHNWTDNRDTGLAAIAPWIEGSASYVRSGTLDCFGPSIEVGAALPTSRYRDVWIGPFVSYTDIFQPNSTAPDAKVLTVGLSFEFGGNQTRNVPAPPHPTPPIVVVLEKKEAPPVVEHTLVNVEYQQTIQFAWDSPVLDAKAQTILSDVVNSLKSSKDFEHLRVEGYASSEGQLQHNNVLALHRAAAVRDFLIASGLKAEKVSAVGFGITHPVASNKTEAGRVLNRRVEFLVKFSVVKVSK